MNKDEINHEKESERIHENHEKGHESHGKESHGNHEGHEKESDRNHEKESACLFSLPSSRYTISPSPSSSRHTTSLSSRHTTSPPSRQSIFSSNMNLVHGVVSKYKIRDSYVREEAVSVGMEELWNCTERWKEEKGKFSTYAWRCVDGKVKLYLGSLRSNSFSYNSGVNRVNYIIYNNPNKSADELYEIVSSQYSITRKTFDNYYKLLSNTFLPIDNESIVKVPYEVDMEENLIKQDLIDSLMKQVNIICRGTSEQTRSIYIDWTKLICSGDDKGCLSFLAKKYGISRQRVNQIINDINKKIRERMNG